MTTFTRTITMIRSGNFKHALREWMQFKLAAGIGWLLSMPPVQAEVARAFSGQTAMCRVLKDAINDAVDSRDTIDEDTASHMIREALENHTIEADDVEGLDRYISDSLEEAITGEAKDEITKAVVEHIVEKLQD
jgi:hypothetical protein